VVFREPSLTTAKNTHPELSLLRHTVQLSGITLELSGGAGNLETIQVHDEK
jgi:hypothetical protein